MPSATWPPALPPITLRWSRDLEFPQRLTLLSHSSRLTTLQRKCLSSTTSHTILPIVFYLVELLDITVDETKSHWLHRGLHAINKPQTDLIPPYTKVPITPNYGLKQISKSLRLLFATF
ncbi:hypothetical protein M501DRAFT_553710 [Patellaria atrata CBS 101060]|uniref:Uncharacterized protein n=1 Tax=Patellaria atrata CBS 101060 TaxID=1346257 RepID=A0A9P4SF66_9PEZI|nr:hypothetical protein M501DRAFT_553710 [Patellaria atrata CBS 101060]